MRRRLQRCGSFAGRSLGPHTALIVAASQGTASAEVGTWPSRSTKGGDLAWWCRPVASGLSNKGLRPALLHTQHMTGLAATEAAWSKWELQPIHTTKKLSI